MSSFAGIHVVLSRRCALTSLPLKFYQNHYEQAHRLQAHLQSYLGSTLCAFGSCRPGNYINLLRARGELGDVAISDGFGCCSDGLNFADKVLLKFAHMPQKCVTVTLVTNRLHFMQHSELPRCDGSHCLRELGSNCEDLVLANTIVYPAQHHFGFLYVGSHAAMHCWVLYSSEVGAGAAALQRKCTALWP